MLRKATLPLAVGLFSTAWCFTTLIASAAAQNTSKGTQQVQEFHGIVVPARTAEISPRYNGLLLKIDFIPGQFVEQGDLLFEFSTTDQQLAVEIDQSKLHRAEADLRMAELTLTNKQSLYTKRIISETETVQAEASRDIASAKVEEASLINLFISR
jgi:multidrug efflux pump subunit AcrA (membrane-fusion protein)